MSDLINLLNTASGAFVAFAGHLLIQSSVWILTLAALDLLPALADPDGQGPRHPCGRLRAG